ncbi:stage III sporulation protein AE [Amphibacillus cookii]|uniref:stage III sporulation protein AE n=1 Tax=Amphibacillus cookii TaxID=767787 RepID=UPI00195A851E|nr:stage III sporulation protein AE [Amphibacillus cookii]MBM7542431.1 stage III sporulation protein AE [Amphibacillus cookii]
MQVTNKALYMVIVLFFSVQSLSYAQTTEIPQEENENIDLFDELNLSDFEAYWDEIRYEYQDYLPEVERMTVKDLINSNHSLSIKDWIVAFINMIGYEVIANGKLLGQLIVITIISALIKNIQTAFHSESISTVANFVLMLLLTTLALQSFSVVSQLITTTIDQMHGFIIALLPLLLGLMATLGGVISISFFHPVIVTFLHLIVVLTDKVILKLIFFSFLLHLVSLLNKTFQLTKLADLFRQIALGMLMISLTVFLTVLSVQGATTAIQDGLAIKTTKFVTNNFIPVVGRMFSEATDTIFAVTQVLKNGLGIFGLVTILLIVGIPIIKVAMIGFSYKMAAAILQPIGESQIVKCVSIIAEHIFYLLAVLLVVSFMFLMTIVMLLIASNLTLMIR